MDITGLKEFLALADTQNFWKASEMLYMNESTLSKHIKKLEAELQVPLFDRSTRKVSLTVYGECLIPYAKEIVEKAQKFHEELEKRLQEESQGLVLGVIPSMVEYHITDILVGFRKAHPEKTVQIMEGDTVDLLEALLHRNCSMAFLRDSSFHPIDDTILEKIPYTKDRLCVLLSSMHPKASCESISLKELSEEEFVVLNQGTLLNQIFHSLCEKDNFTPKIAMECKWMNSIFDLVAKNMGISILTDKHFDINMKNRMADRNALALVPLEPAVYSQTYLCYRKDEPLNATSKEMIKYMKETGSCM